MSINLVWPKNVPEIHCDLTLRGGSVISSKAIGVRAAIVTSFAHAMYEATSDLLLKPRPMRLAKLRGWRYAIVRNYEDISAIEFRASHDAESEIKLDALLTGDDLADLRLMQFLLAVSCCRVARGTVYEPRLLRLPDHCLEVLWLKPKRLGSLFVPLDSSRVGLMPGRAYSLASLRHALVGLRPGKER